MAIEEEFGVSVERDGKSLRIVVTGELDIATVPLLLAHLERDGATEGADAIVLDLLGVTFIGSSGLRALLVARDAIGDRLQIIPGDRPGRVRRRWRLGRHPIRVRPHQRRPSIWTRARSVGRTRG
jgi:anti-anti-sigma factor